MVILPLLNNLSLPLLPIRRESLGVSYTEAARLTGLSSRTIRRMAADGRVRVVKIGRRRVVSLKNLHELIP